MITTLEIIEIMYDELKGSELDISASGGLYKLQRPLGSTKEDIVINCLPVSNEQIQRATVNVNIYAQDIPIRVDGVQQHAPDIDRLQFLAAKAVHKLESIYYPGYSLVITQQSVIKEEAVNQHFINIRIEFRFINPKN